MSIVVLSPQDRGNLDLNLCTVTGVGDAAIVDLHVRCIKCLEFDPRSINYSFYGQITGVNGVRPTFRIRTSKLYGTDSTERFMWTMDDPSSPTAVWKYFDTRVSGTGYVDVRNNLPFTSDTIYIARYFAWPVSRVTNWCNWLMAQNNVQPLAENGIVAMSGERTTELGTIVPSQPVYAFKITNMDASPIDGSAKRVAILTSGVHPGEDGGMEALKGAVDFLLSSDPKAQSALQNFEFFIFPCITPAGRHGGAWRSEFDINKDVNRHWHDNTQAALVTIRPIIMTAVSGRPVAVFCDFHNRIGNYVMTYHNSTSVVTFDQWKAVRAAYYPSQADVTTYTEWTSSAWAASYSTGPHAQLSLAPEVSFYARPTQASLNTWGGSFVKCFVDLYNQGKFPV